MDKKKLRVHIARGEFERVCRRCKSLWAHEWDSEYLRSVKSFRGPHGEHRRNKQMQRFYQ